MFFPFYFKSLWLIYVDFFFQITMKKSSLHIKSLKLKIQASY